MLLRRAEPLRLTNAIEQLEMQGGMLIQQGPVLQLSLLDYHFALRWVEIPGEWAAWLQSAASEEMKTLHLHLSAAGTEGQIRIPAGLEHCRVESLEEVFQRHRLAAETGQTERILITLEMQDAPCALVCDYIV